MKTVNDLIDIPELPDYPCFVFAHGGLDYLQSVEVMKIVSDGQTGVDRGALDAAILFVCEIRDMDAIAILDHQH